jgi:hypothetical protein
MSLASAVRTISALPTPADRPGRRARESARQAADPWPVIPAEIADQLRPLLPELVEEMVAEIHLTVAEYARPDDDRYARAVRRGAEEAAHQFLDRIASPDAAWDRAAAVFRSLGSAEAGEGRSLEALESALRAGARVALRWLTHASQFADAPLETLGFLAEALFVFLDKIAALSAEGYAQAQGQVAGELQRRRRRLVGLLLAEPPAATEAVSELARLAQWRPPRLVSVVVLAGHDLCDGRDPALPGDWPTPSWPGWRRARAAAWRLACSYIRRRPATACTSCRTCSGSNWTTRTRVSSSGSCFARGTRARGGRVRQIPLTPPAHMVVITGLVVEDWVSTQPGYFMQALSGRPKRRRQPSGPDNSV